MDANKAFYRATVFREKETLTKKKAIVSSNREVVFLCSDTHRSLLNRRQSELNCPKISIPKTSMGSKRKYAPLELNTIVKIFSQ